MSLTITPEQHHTFLTNQAKEFRTKYSIGNSMGLLPRTKQKSLITEEYKEFLEAHDDLWKNNPTITAACLKELADLVYVCYQYAANMEWDLDEALHRVHESNMSKLGTDGKPIYREDGKVLKGPNYAPPNLEDLI
tara:strand:+ start:1167 stop:1571 length:405 start_codon:yes stop_codon:yes gene_type:complete